MRAKIVSVAVAAGPGISPTLASDISPNMNCMSNLFQSLEFRIADKTVARVSDFVAQVDTLEKRLTKSQSWLNSVGKELDWLAPLQQERANAIASDGAEYKSFTVAEPRVPVTKVVAGFNAATTLQWAQATKVLTLNNGGVNIQNGPGVLHVGDIIQIIAAVNNFTVGQRIEITEILTSTTARAEFLNEPNPANIAEGLENFNILRAEDLAQNESFQRNDFEMIWQPPLSIFKIGHGMPSGKYEIVLNPQNSGSYRKKAVESVLADLIPLQTPTVLNDFSFEVTDMYLYLATVEGPAVSDIQYYMSLEQTRCQIEQIGPADGLQQKNFDVSPSTYALTVAFQDTAATGDNTLFSSSKFKIRTKGVYEDAATSLRRLYIQYAGEFLPQ